MSVETVCTGSKRATGAADVVKPEDCNVSEPVVLQATSVTPTVKVVPPGAKTLNITKGFEVPSEKTETGKTM